MVENCQTIAIPGLFASLDQKRREYISTDTNQIFLQHGARIAQICSATFYVCKNLFAFNLHVRSKLDKKKVNIFFND